MWLSNDFDSHIAQLPNIRNHSPRRPSVSGTPCQMSSHQWLWYHHLEASWLPCQRHCIHSARPIHRCDIRWRLAIIIQIQIHTSACGWVAHNGWVQCSQQCEYLLICLASRFMTCISSGCNAFRAALATTVARNGDVRYPNTNPKLNPVPNLYHTTNANPIANRKNLPNKWNISAPQFVNMRAKSQILLPACLRTEMQRCFACVTSCGGSTK